jgi:hypothetical protein
MKTLNVYTIIESANDEYDDYWCRIGTAFENKDGSLNVKLNALPVNGSLHIREPHKEDERPS